VSSEPVFFETPAQFRRWLQTHAKRAELLWVGYHKVGSGRPSITWNESVDEALCFGWIDGIRKNVDDQRYMIRFTPRKSGSVWSTVNTKRTQSLIQRRLMRPAGLAAFQARQENRSGIYSYEQRPLALPEPYAGELRRNRAALKFFAAQAASYRKAAVWWVISAKQASTRLRRARQLVEDSQLGRHIKQFDVRTTTRDTVRSAASGTGRRSS
jgi:uncharacterized protein YdeI (YjbR/CyaY-like superfamily)